MNPRTWSAEDRTAYELICKQAWAASESTTTRAHAFESLIADAEQAQQTFARDVLREATHRGLSSLLKSWHKSQRTLMFTYDGRPLTKSAVIGVRRVVDDREVDVQALIHAVTFEELRQKRYEFLSQAKAYSINVAFIDRALALADLVPTATTPDEALTVLGTTLADWFAEEAS